MRDLLETMISPRSIQLLEWLSEPNITTGVSDQRDRSRAASAAIAAVTVAAVEGVPSARTQLRQRAESGSTNPVDHLVIESPTPAIDQALEALGWEFQTEHARWVHADHPDDIAQLSIETDSSFSLDETTPRSERVDDSAIEVIVRDLVGALSSRCRHVAIRVDDAAAAAEDAAMNGLPIEERLRCSPDRRVREARHRVSRASDGEPPRPSFGLIERHPRPDAEPGEGSLDLSLDLTEFEPLGNDTGGARRVTRPAFTFKVRRRHLSAKRQAEFDEWIERWSVPIDGPTLDWDAIFNRTGGARRNGLDIGFGHGESTIVMARAEPDLDVIGIEVHDPGVVTVLDAIENEPLRNVRVMHGDALRFLRRVEADSLDVVRIFFPDPWKKVRQHHRRLVRDDVVAALTDRLRPGGVLHLATDIADYAEQMQAVCDAEARLSGGVIPRPESRPLTRFEQRGIDAGRPPVDLWYERR